jgi:hypothetical protein
VDTLKIDRSFVIDMNFAAVLLLGLRFLKNDAGTQFYGQGVLDHLLS